MTTYVCDICKKTVNNFPRNTRQWYGGMKINISYCSGKTNYDDICDKCDDAIQELILKLKDGE